MDIKQILNSDEQFRYQLLDRMKMDCDYYLTHGNRNSKNLWALNEQEHIDYMKAIWDSFAKDKKPEWLTLDKIKFYEKHMVTYHNNKNQLDIDAIEELCNTYGAITLFETLDKNQRNMFVEAQKLILNSGGNFSSEKVRNLYEIAIEEIAKENGIKVEHANKLPMKKQISKARKQAQQINTQHKHISQLNKGKAR